MAAPRQLDPKELIWGINQGQKWPRIIPLGSTDGSETVSEVTSDSTIQGNYTGGDDFPFSDATGNFSPFLFNFPMNFYAFKIKILVLISRIYKPPKWSTSFGTQSDNHGPFTVFTKNARDVCQQEKMWIFLFIFKHFLLAGQTLTILLQNLLSHSTILYGHSVFHIGRACLKRFLW